jgi:hypothetical protein
MQATLILTAMVLYLCILADNVVAAADAYQEAEEQGGVSPMQPFEDEQVFEEEEVEAESVGRLREAIRTVDEQLARDIEMALRWPYV